MSALTLQAFNGWNSSFATRLWVDLLVKHTPRTPTHQSFLPFFPAFSWTQENFRIAIMSVSKMPACKKKKVTLFELWDNTAFVENKSVVDFG
jgi:hypothetical protein